MRRRRDWCSHDWRDFGLVLSKLERLRLVLLKLERLGLVLLKLERLRRLTQRLAQIFKHCYQYVIICCM